MAQLIWVLNGINIIEDWKQSTPISVLIDQGRVNGGLVVTTDLIDEITVSEGVAFIEVVRTGNTFLVDFHNTTPVVFSSVVFPQKVWIEINTANVVDGSANNIDGSAIGEIKIGATYPVSGFWIPLASVDAWGLVTDDSVVIDSIPDVITNIINTIINGDNAFYKLATGAINTYSMTYDNAVLAPWAPTTISWSAMLAFKANNTNSWSVTISVNTTAGVLTGPLKKMHDQDIEAGDIEAGQIVWMVWNETGGFFQMQSQLAQVDPSINIWSNVLWTAWEDVLIWQPWFSGTWLAKKRIISQTNSGNDQAFGNLPYIFLHQMLIAQTDNVIYNIRVRLRKIWAPVDNVRCRIYAEDHTTLIATSTNVFNGGIITGAFLNYNFDFANISLNVNQKYWIELSRDGAVNVGNYYIADSNNISPYVWEFGELNGRQGIQYDYINGAIYHQVFTKKDYEPNKWYLSDSDYVETGKVHGIFAETINQNSNGSITVAWANPNQTLQDTWEEHFISNSIFWLNQLQQNTAWWFWYQLNNQEAYAQAIRLTKWLQLNKIALYLGKVWSPTDNMTVTIESDNNGTPSGVVLANWTIQVAWVSLWFKLKTYYLEFPGNVAITENTQYWITLRRTGALDTSNYYVAWIINSVQYQFGNAQSKQATWTNQVASLAFDLMEQYNIQEYLQQNVTQLEPIGNSNFQSISQNTPIFFDRDKKIRGLMIYLQKSWAPVDNTIATLYESNPYRYYSFVWGIDTSFWQTGSFNQATQPFSIQSENDPTFSISKVTSDVTNQFPAFNTDNIVIRIETDLAGNPSWVLAHVNATLTILNANIPTSRTAIDYNFAGTVTLNTNTRYHLVWSRTVPIPSHYYTLYSTAPTLIYDTAKRLNTVWPVWTNLNANIWFGFPELDSPGTLIGTASISNTLVVAGANRRFYFDFGSLVDVEKGKRYWINIRRSGVSDPANFVSVWLHTTNSFYNELVTQSNAWVYRYDRQLIYHVLEKYTKPIWNITLHPPANQIVLEGSNFEKVGDAVSPTEIVLNNNIKSINISQVVTQNITYYSGVGGHFSAWYTRAGAGVTTIQLSIGDSPTSLVTYSGTYATGNVPVGMSAYIPKGKYWTFSIAGTIATGNAYFYIK